MNGAMTDTHGNRSSKRILAFAGFGAAVLLAGANAVWGVDADVWAFLSFSAACAGFTIGERFGSK